jgi:response regulator RpfG family c-di-GMP phosphodiesterase
VERAVDFLQTGAGSHFDPLCVAAFLSRLEDALVIRASYQDAGPHPAHLDD